MSYKDALGALVNPTVAIGSAAGAAGSGAYVASQGIQQGLGAGLAVGESALAYYGQKRANESNERIARENRQFQERMVNQAQNFEKNMSSSAYQRSMLDMKKAGLNPILAYKQGGASTPIGKTAAGATATMLNEFGGMSGSMVNNLNTASTIMTQRQNRENMQSKLENDAAYRALNTEQQNQVKATIDKIETEIKNIEAQTAERITENEIREIIAKSFSENNALALFDRLGVGPSAIGIIGTYYGLKNANERGFGIKIGGSVKDEYTPGGNRRENR